MLNDLHPLQTDPSSLAAAGLLARYREPTVSAFRNDVRCYWTWCEQHELQPLQALHPLELAAVLPAARQHSDTAHALVALLGMLGLRVSEACQATVADLQYIGGYQVLHVLGKGSKPADISLPIPVLRAVQAAVAGRGSGPTSVSRPRPVARGG